MNSSNEERSMNILLEKHKFYFDTYIFDGVKNGFIFHDIQVSLDSNLNYLTSLGLMCYTEFLGGLMPKLENENPKIGKDHKKFNRFLHRLDSPSFRYKYLDEVFMKSLNTSIYHMFRCGLVHEYFIKQIRIIDQKKNKRYIMGTAIAKSAKPSDCIAIGQMSDGRIVMANQQYLRDFKKLLVEWRLLLFEKKDQRWIKAFESGRGQNIKLYLSDNI